MCLAIGPKHWVNYAITYADGPFFALLLNWHVQYGAWQMDSLHWPLQIHAKPDVHIQYAAGKLHFAEHLSLKKHSFFKPFSSKLSAHSLACEFILKMGQSYKIWIWSSNTPRVLGSGVVVWPIINTRSLLQNSGSRTGFGFRTSSKVRTVWILSFGLQLFLRFVMPLALHLMTKVQGDSWHLFKGSHRFGSH